MLQASLLLLLVQPTALALDADTFEPSGSAWQGTGGLQVPYPLMDFPKAYYMGLGLIYADDPVVLTYPDGSEEPVVDSQFSMALGAGYNFGGKARLELSLPFYPSVHLGEAADTSSGASLGDTRLGATVPLVGLSSRPVGLAVLPALRLPTGSEARYTGSPGLGLDLAGVVAGKLGSGGWNTELGLDLGKKEELKDLDFGSSFHWGAGAFLPAGGHGRLGAELTGLLTLAGDASFRKNPLEGHAYWQFLTPDGLVLTTGLGTGLVAGVGAPDVRLFLLLSYRDQGEPPVYDRDADGILDENDACPDSPEDVDHFQDEDGCPDPDNDGDGITDARDQCPEQPEDMDHFKDGDGCPDPDNDGDRVLDVEDDCPDEAGSLRTHGCPDADDDGIVDSEDDCPQEAGPKETRGCPDRDHDRVPDKRDKCPDKPADPRIDPARSDGCPARVIVTAKKIEILDKIYFETGKAKIKRKSYDLLAEIAKVINDNPDIRKIEIAGHTDSQGSDEYNLKLSQARAEAVMQWLVKNGHVDPSRLVARGYGETRPVASNDTPEGRAKNRRVEFIILEQ